MPIVAEVYKSKNVYNPKRLFGVTTLDVVRASRFVSEIKKTDPAGEAVPVVGGHSGVTIVPLLSQSNHPDISGEALDALINRIQFGGDEMAMAGARFAESLLKASQSGGREEVIEPTFVDSPLYKNVGVDFFASRVRLGPQGVEEILPVGKVTEHEQQLIDAALGDLKKNITKGMYD